MKDSIAAANEDDLYYADLNELLELHSRVVLRLTRLIWKDHGREFRVSTLRTQDEWQNGRRQAKSRVMPGVFLFPCFVLLHDGTICDFGEDVLIPTSRDCYRHHVRPIQLGTLDDARRDLLKKAYKCFLAETSA